MKPTGHMTNPGLQDDLWGWHLAHLVDVGCQSHAKHNEEGVVDGNPTQWHSLKDSQNVTQRWSNDDRTCDICHNKQCYGNGDAHGEDFPEKKEKC